MDKDFILRPETEKDYFETENLTREAFWNKYRPGCEEHYILHKYRSSPDFVNDLDYVIEKDGRIIAHIMYSKAEINCDDGKVLPVMIFGPISVLPEFQNMGYGSAIIKFTLEKAKSLGCKAVAITGNPEYYHRFGFVSGSDKKVFYYGVPRDEKADFFMIKELAPGYLDEVTGTFKEPLGYDVDKDELEEFDLKFPRKEKKKLPGQLV